MVGNWLYGVARRTASKARALTARRKARERQVAEVPEPAVVETDTRDGLRPVLDQELSRLPEKYRVSVVLCDLEGRTRTEAARQLGWPEGTVAGRLARARAMLARRLARRGLAPPGAAAAVALAREGASACVPAALTTTTIRAAGKVAAGQAAAGAVPASVAALTEGVLRTMLLSKLKTVTGVLLFAVASLAAGWVWASQVSARERDRGGGALLAKADAHVCSDRPSSRQRLCQP
jgi:hypothetical protein